MAKKWRAAAVRIFTNKTTGVTFEDICRSLKYFWDSKDIRSKASLQFLMMDQHINGELTYKEAKKHMSMLVDIIALLLKFKIPGQFKLDKNLRKTYSDDEFIELAQKISSAVSNVRLDLTFARALNLTHNQVLWNRPNCPGSSSTRSSRFVARRPIRKRSARQNISDSTRPRTEISLWPR